MMNWHVSWLAGIVLAMSALGSPAVAQETGSGQAEAPAGILTLDVERLFAETAYGRRVVRDIEADAATLATENRRIEAELIDEERALTDRRASLSVEEFRTLADAFDTKVDRIREEQDGKTRELQRRREVERQRFFGQIGPILSALVQERRAAVVLDRRSVFIAAESVDVTVEAIARIDAEIGDGVPLPEVTPPGDGE